MKVILEKNVGRHRSTIFVKVEKSYLISSDVQLFYQTVVELGLNLKKYNLCFCLRGIHNLTS